jgi:TRAP-type C4-dicarboxylate transport system permease small subunit
MLSLSGLVGVVIYLIVGGLILWLLLWLVDYAALPAPFNRIAKVVLMVAAVLIVICALLSLVGGGPVVRP